MRIGLFSDFYFPSVNGISFVLQITYEQLTKLGHEVYIFAPASNLRGKEPNDPPYVYRFPAVEGLFFDEQFTSVFFPPSQLRKIKRLELDLIHYFTPGQIGLLGVHAAIKEDIPLVSQYSTDLYQYVEKYPTVLPGTIALSLSTPFFLRMTPRELMKLLTVFKPHYRLTAWHKNIIKKMHVMLHNRSDAVIALSTKMKKQLDSWGSQTEATLMPTGIDQLPQPSHQDLAEFRRSFGITDDDQVMLYVGRLSKEKNLDLLIDSFEYVAAARPTAKLMMVGDFDYRERLEARAGRSSYADRVIFTGRIERQKLGLAYGIASVFVFPSLTDTQGLVVNEAAAAGLPLVMCDPDVSEVFVPNESGLLAPNSVKGFAEIVGHLLDNPRLRNRLAKGARSNAGRFTEHGQAKRLEKLYIRCIKQHRPRKYALR